MNSNNSYVVSDKNSLAVKMNKWKHNGSFNDPEYRKQIENMEVRYYLVTPVKDKNNYNKYLRVTNATGKTPYLIDGKRDEFKGPDTYLRDYKRVSSGGRRTHKRSKKARKSRKSRRRHHH